MTKPLPTRDELVQRINAETMTIRSCDHETAQDAENRRDELIEQLLHLDEHTR